MDTTEKKALMLSAISEELDLWLSKECSIKDGYEYETEFISLTRKVNQILLAKSLGTSSTNRNKKNFRPVLGSSMFINPTC
jgi:hypothetical protein